MADALLARGGEELVEEIGTIMRRLLSAGWKFVEFMKTFLPPPPEARPEFGQVDWAKMEQHLKTIYKWRSLALHEALPLPLPWTEAPRFGRRDAPPEEATLGLSTMARNAVWEAKDCPMHLHTFVYIVQGALVGWWGSLEPV